ncbi:MAG: hypothetical protein KGM49_05770 [Sphingomonadales bacterium]|nr:hypothetical protein [Sphingomonadales bacterium]
MASILLLAAAVPAHAEKLSFDHRLYPPLKAALDSGDADRVAYDASNPRYVIDLIAITGKSAANWSEALEIIARTPEKKVRTARDWVAELRGQAGGSCSTSQTTIAEDRASITFERHSPNCATARAETTITRVLAGKRSLFAVSFLLKGAPDEATRRQWLALLASAHIE